METRRGATNCSTPQFRQPGIARNNSHKLQGPCVVEQLSGAARERNGAFPDATGVVGRVGNTWVAKDLIAVINGRLLAETPVAGVDFLVPAAHQHSSAGGTTGCCKTTTTCEQSRKKGAECMQKFRNSLLTRFGKTLEKTSNLPYVLSIEYTPTM